MNIILVGPQGSGKGTQADLLTKKFNLEHFSTGEELRKTAKTETTLGKKLKTLMTTGELISDEILFEIVEKKVSSSKGIIFDGFPRNKNQAKFLESITKIDAFIEINIDDEESIRRISSRLVCENCGKGYNKIFLKPKQEGICDVCNGKLIQRADDTPNAVKKRLLIYHKETEPLKEFYKNTETLILVINGKNSIEKVQEDILTQLEKKNLK